LKLAEQEARKIGALLDSVDRKFILERVNRSL
jgi:hypothetical protein